MFPKPRTLPRTHPSRDEIRAYIAKLNDVQQCAILLGFTSFGSQFDEPIAAARMALRNAVI